MQFTNQKNYVINVLAALAAVFISGEEYSVGVKFEEFGDSQQVRIILLSSVLRVSSAGVSYVSF